MLTFLNQVILYALPAIAIPLLIHLFTKQKLKKIPFSSLEFLKEMRKETIRRLKLKQILLIILRTLIILLLILAFARPALKQNLALGKLSGSGRATIAIILDNSLSMSLTIQGTPAFDYAKNRAYDIVNLLKPGDEVYLIAPLSPGRVRVIGPKYNFESIRQTIQATPLSWYGTDLPGAIQTAQKLLLAANNFNREIYLISDLQASGFHPQKAPYLPLLQPGIRLFLAPIQAEQSRNISVARVELINQILEQGKPAEVVASIRNHGNAPVANTLIQLFIGGKRVNQTTLTLQPAQTQQVSFKFTPDQVGFQSGYLSLEADDLARDNRRYFAFYVPEQIRVLLVGNRLQDVNYFNWALNPRADSALSLKSTSVRGDQLTTVDFNAYHVVVLSNVPGLPAAVLTRLVTYVKNGGGLLMALGSEVNIRDYNTHVNSLFNLPHFTDPVGRLDSREAFLSFGKIDFSHPIFQTVFEAATKQIDSPQFYFSFKVAALNQAEAIISYNNQYPFLIESRVGRGRVLLFTSATDPNWSDWTVKGIFAPLINRSVNYLTGTSNLPDQELIVGNEIQYTSSQVTNILELELEKPDQRRIRVRPEVKGGNLVVQFSEVDMHGVYQLRHQATVLGQWAANVEPMESVLTPVADDTLQKVLGANNYREIKPHSNLTKTVNAARYGKELWQILVLLAFILLIIEMWLYRQKTNPASHEMSRETRV
ncbi:BatA domain-containing protein [candidate division KSB1 bacterium]|nr:BatA domain-containing protein [candidate division KSB1 bacterium]